MFRKLLLSLVLIAMPAFAIAADPVTERPGVQAAPKQNAPAPLPRPAEKSQIRVPGSLWVGSEELNNNGRLEFALRSNGVATMVDAHSRIDGTWKLEGNEIVIAFKNCVYRGTIQGNELVGRGRITEGQGTGQNWGFRVAYTNVYAGREMTGSEQLNGSSPLTFRFAADGTAIMIDASPRPVQGTYTFDYDVVTVTFQNCVYTGTVQNGVYRGTARVTDGSNLQPWEFSVRAK